MLFDKKGWQEWMRPRIIAPQHRSCSGNCEEFCFASWSGSSLSSECCYSKAGRTSSTDSMFGNYTQENSGQLQFY